MIKYLFHGKRTDNGEWVEGYVTYNNTRKQYYIMDDVNAFPMPVYADSVGQYTGINEFVVTDRSYHKPLFEGDIVEVWSTRRPCYGYPKSQCDGDIKVRAVICFHYGQWTLDYDNNYNKSLAKLTGKEEDERTVEGDSRLYRFSHHSNEDWYRERNNRYKWGDIVKLGNMFDNKDLLEG